MEGAVWQLSGSRNGRRKLMQTKDGQTKHQKSKHAQRCALAGRPLVPLSLKCEFATPAAESSCCRAGERLDTAVPNSVPCHRGPQGAGLLSGAELSGNSSIPQCTLTTANKWPIGKTRGHTPFRTSWKRASASVALRSLAGFRLFYIKTSLQQISSDMPNTASRNNTVQRMP